MDRNVLGFTFSSVTVGGVALVAVGAAILVAGAWRFLSRTAPLYFLPYWLFSSLALVLAGASAMTGEIELLLAGGISFLLMGAVGLPVAMVFGSKDPDELTRLFDVSRMLGGEELK